MFFFQNFRFVMNTNDILWSTILPYMCTSGLYLIHLYRLIVFICLCRESCLSRSCRHTVSVCFWNGSRWHRCLMSSLLTDWKTTLCQVRLTILSIPVMLAYLLTYIGNLCVNCALLDCYWNIMNFLCQPSWNTWLLELFVHVWLLQLFIHLLYCSWSVAANQCNIIMSAFHMLKADR